MLFSVLNVITDVISSHSDVTAAEDDDDGDDNYCDEDCNCHLEVCWGGGGL